MPASSQQFRTDQFVAGVSQQANLAVERGAQNLTGGVGEGMGLVQQMQQIQSNQLRLARDEIALREYEERVAIYDKELAIRSRVAEVSMIENQARAQKWALDQQRNVQQQDIKANPFVVSPGGDVYRKVPSMDGEIGLEKVDSSDPGAQQAIFEDKIRREQPELEADLLRSRAEENRAQAEADRKRGSRPSRSSPAAQLRAINTVIEDWESLKKNARFDTTIKIPDEEPENVKIARRVRKKVLLAIEKNLSDGDGSAINLDFSDPDDEGPLSGSDLQVAMGRVFNRFRGGEGGRVEDDFPAIIMAAISKADEDGVRQQVEDRIEDRIQDGVERLLESNPDMELDEAMETVLRQIAADLQAGGITNPTVDIFENFTSQEDVPKNKNVVGRGIIEQYRNKGKIGGGSSK